MVTENQERDVTVDAGRPSSAGEVPIEGLADGDHGGLGDYPIDTLLIRKETRTVFEVVR